MEKVIKVNVYTKFNPQNPNEGVIGQVDASYVSDGKGGYLKDANGNPYLAPVGYSPYKSWEEGLNNPMSLLEYRTDGPKDLQRNFNGVSFGGFVPAFTPIASFDVGVACSGAVGISADVCIMGGGAVNLKNRISNSNINIDGQYFNNPKNVPNIKQGYQWGEETFPSVSDFLNDLLKQGVKKINDSSENITDPLNQNTPQFAQMGIQQQNQDFITQGFAALLSDNPQQGMNQMLNSDYAKTFDIQAKQVLAQDDAQKQQELAQVQEMSTPKMVRS